MTGSILQLVANTGAYQNRWIDGDPEVTFFKKVFRRHTPFATEMVKVAFNSPLDFGNGSDAIIPFHGDLACRIFLVFDIPFLAAAFLNTKAEDIIKIVNNSGLIDVNLVERLKKLTDINEELEITRIVDTIKETETCYLTEQEIRYVILGQLNEFASFLGFYQIPNQLAYQQSTFNPEEIPQPIPPKPKTLEELDEETGMTYNFYQLKMDLAAMWLDQKKEYYLIYELLKLAYDVQTNAIDKIPILDTYLLTNIITYASVFFDYIPSREILLMYYIKSLNYTTATNQKTSSLIETFDIKISDTYSPIIEDYDQYVFYNQVYSNKTFNVIIDNPDATIPLQSFDTHTLLEKVTFDYNNLYSNLSEVQNEFYDFGPSFYYLLNSFNSIIGIINNMRITTPIVVLKSFQVTSSPFNVYTDIAGTGLQKSYPTIIDPNFKDNYIINVNRLEKPPVDGMGMPLPYVENNHQIYPNKYVNEYLRLFNEQSSFMFNNILNAMDKLFVFYNQSLFLSTETLFLYNTPPLSNIYSYIVPTQGYQDNSALRIENVLNLNVWFFYFFKYLDSFNEATYVNYIDQYTSYNLSPNGLLFMQSMITLLKLNIEYYMSEISYMLNSMYSVSPSPNANDTMKNYVPVAQNQIINGINVKTDLLGVTMMMHRNHTQTIMEMFQYIYYFCDYVTYQRMNDYLGTTITQPTEQEDTIIRRLNKLLYYRIMAYFMNVYDSFSFEAPVNYTTNEFSEADNFIINQYVIYFLKGTKFTLSIPPSLSQTTLENYVSQMEFYFCSEMVSMREQQKLYNDCFFNRDLIESTVGRTTFEIITLIIRLLISNDLNHPDVVLNDVDVTRKYYDRLYQHNARLGQADDLYYSTFDLDRYTGQLYQDTSYQTRFYGEATAPIPPPTPLPPIIPYGIPSFYYDHKQCISDYSVVPPLDIETLSNHIPVYWLLSENAAYNTQKISQSFEMYYLDYFRVKHSVWSTGGFIVPSNVVFIDTYQLNILRAIKLTERSLLSQDSNLTYWLWTTVYLLRDNTITTVPYTTYLGVYNLGLSPTLYTMLDTFTNQLALSLTGTALDQNLLIECYNGLNELSNDFNDGVAVKIGGNSDVYTSSQLSNCNLFSYNNVLNQSIDDPKSIFQSISLLRLNYLSQYFFYAKHNEAILKTQNIQVYSDLFTFRNISTIVYNIINQISDNTAVINLLKNTSSLVYIYPDVYPIQVQNIVNSQNQLDDYSQVVSKLTTSFLSPNTTQRLTFKDIFDLINFTFTSTEQIYDYCIDNALVDFMLAKLLQYQQKMLNKIALFNQMNEYILTIPQNTLMTVDDVVILASYAEQYGIAYVDYYDYLDSVIKVDFNAATIANKAVGVSYQRMVIINIVMYNDLDYFFLKQIDQSVSMGISFKAYIINDIFDVQFLQQHLRLRGYFSFIENNYFSFIYTFMKYAVDNKLTPDTISNPLIIYDKFYLIEDQGIIATQYGNMEYLINIIVYFMDFIWDWTMTFCDRNPSFSQNEYGYGKRVTTIVNEIHARYLASINDKIDQLEEDRIKAINESIERLAKEMDLLKRKAYFNNKKISEIMAEIDIIDKTLKSTTYPVSNYDYYFDNINERSAIISFIKLIVAKGLIILEDQLNKITNFQNQMYNVFYRNKKAKLAWIRKLAHYVVQQVEFLIDDESIDTCYSNWFESFHELTKNDGSEYGYQKMIGHRDDLIVFDDKIKKSYTVTLPLIFYFNKNVSGALPLNASINIKYTIAIKMRSLNDVTYKDQFSSFVTPDTLSMVQPKITNSYLMVEYIYLTTQERRLFVTRLLEYLMEETQYDSANNINDKTSLPVYLLGNTKKTITVVKNGIKTKETFYEKSKGIYMNSEQLQLMSYEYDLIPRSDYVPEETTIRGIKKLMMVNRPIDVDTSIHKKQINIQFNFHNPTEMMTILIRPTHHIVPTERKDERYYFYGEKQWDNFSLYSHHDLTKIYDAKKSYYDQLVIDINDRYNQTYGFVAIINKVILKYSVPVVPLNQYDQWINDNREYFLEVLFRIRDAFVAYNGVFTDYSNIIRAKENIMSLNINYNVWEKDFLIRLINDIYNQLGFPAPTEQEIIDVYSSLIDSFDINDFSMPKNIFRLGIMELLKTYILDGTLNINTIDNAINSIYDNYNEVEVNMLLSTVLGLLDITASNYNIYNAMDYIYNLYISLPSSDENITDIIRKIINQLQLTSPSDILIYNIYMIQFLFYKQTIYQVVPLLGKPAFEDYLTLIPKYVVFLVSLKMNEMFNSVIDSQPVNMINYQENISEMRKVNPLIGGYLSFNAHNFVPENVNGTWWEDVNSYLYLLHTPSTGINVYSWSLRPIDSQPYGSINLSRMDEFKGTFFVNPVLGDKYPATLEAIAMSINLVRYLSGIGAKTWSYSSRNIE